MSTIPQNVELLKNLFHLSEDRHPAYIAYAVDNLAQWRGRHALRRKDDDDLPQFFAVRPVRQPPRTGAGVVSRGGTLAL